MLVWGYFNAQRYVILSVRKQFTINFIDKILVLVAWLVLWRNLRDGGVALPMQQQQCWRSFGDGGRSCVDGGS